MKMPISAVGMIAAHLYLERVRAENMNKRDMEHKVPGSTQTYADYFATDAAREAWRIAEAVELTCPQGVNN